MICIPFIVLTIFLFIRSLRKQKLDTTEKHKLETDVELLKQEKSILQNNIADLNQQSDLAIERFENATRDRAKELSEYFNNQRNQRQQLLDNEIALREAALNESLTNKQQAEELRFQQQIEENNRNISEFARQVTIAQEQCQQVLDECEKKSLDAQQKYNGLLEPIRQYEMQRQEKLFYTIQLPEEFQEDIDFLLTTVAAKVQHPDIISKLVWAEYVKPYLDDTCKRVDIRDEAGIYKITNINSGMAYIGKSTNVKKRIQDHFKSSVGITSIADQRVHHEILKTGFWNWSIEVITYADKDKLNELEKYYIEFFKTQEFGYNKNSGGGG